MLSKSLILTVLISFPFWEILTAQINYFFHVPILFLGLTKYLILYALTSVLLMRFLYKKSPVVNKHSSLIIIYTVYILLHIIGDVHPMLVLDGLKYEFIYPFIGMLILINKKNPLPNFDTLSNIIIIQGAILVIFALFELNNQAILEIAYRRPLESIPHIHWFSINRLISFAINPINLGALVIIFLSFLYFKLLQKRSTFIKVIFISFLILSLIVISGTLSRSSLLTYLIVVFLMVHFYFNNPLYRIILYSVLCAAAIGIITYLSYTYDLSLYFKRFVDLFTIAEYSDNARVFNWINAFSQMNYLDMLWGKGIGISTPSGELGLLYGGIMIENSFISHFLEFGFIGFILYLAVFARYFYLIKILKKFNENISVTLFIFLIIFILFSMGNDYNRNLPFNIYFWFLYAYLEKLIYMYKRSTGNEIIINNSNIR